MTTPGSDLSALATTTSVAHPFHEQKNARPIGDLPAELMIMVFHLSIDSDVIEQKAVKPLQALDILMAPLRICSYYRVICSAEKPIWRAIAASIPSVIFKSGGFLSLLRYCGQRADDQLDAVFFKIPGLTAITPCYLAKIMESIEFMKGSAQSLRGIGFPSLPPGAASCSCDRCAQSSQLLTTSTVLDAMRLLFVQAQGYATTSSTSILTISATFEDLLRISKAPTSTIASPRRLCLVVKTANTAEAEFWTTLGKSLVALCFINDRGRWQGGVDQLPDLLQACQGTVKYVEVHTARSMNPFSQDALPALKRLRVHLTGSARPALLEGLPTSCPSLLFIDVPLTILNRFSCPSITHAAVTLDAHADASSMTHHLREWTQLRSLVVHFDQQAGQESATILKAILDCLVPGKIQKDVYCPHLEHIVITNTLPRWYNGVYSPSQLSDMGISDWWKDIATASDSKKGRLQLSFDPFEVLHVRNEVAELFRENKFKRLVRYNQIEECSALLSMRCFGCDVALQR